MLVKRGLLTESGNLWSKLEDLFLDNCFFNGQRPDCNFLTAFEVLLRRQESHPRVNNFFKKRSLLQVFSHAGWNVSRIPDEENCLAPGLTFIRLAETKRQQDRVTGKVTLANTHLVRRLRSIGFKDEGFIKLSDSTSLANSEVCHKLMEQVQSNAHVDLKVEKANESQNDGPTDPSHHLAALRDDFINVICGQNKPLSGLNCIAVLACCFLLFE
ncbi:hypothetical protein N7540_002150 [Penicillium herquei]|nr:hypothetical protein N7540_002150 [Penicillium herquei]